MCWWQDLAIWLCLFGLTHLLGGLMQGATSNLPAPLWRLLAWTVLGLVAFLLAWIGLPPGAWPGAIEQMQPTAHLGWPLILLGGLGLLRAGVRMARRWLGLVRPAQGGVPSRLRAAAWLALLAWPRTLLPPFGIDETAYHLALPAIARYRGHLAAPLGHANGAFYALADWFGSLALQMGSLSAARGTQLLVVSLALDAAVAIVPPALRARVLVAGLLLLAAPVVWWQLATAYVDVVAAMLAGTAALAWARARALLCADRCSSGPAVGESLLSDPFKERFDRGAALAWLGAAGWLFGAAAATKATLLPLPLLFLGWLAARGPRPGPGLRLGPALLVCLPLLPFVTYGLVAYHSPLFPFVPPLWPSDPSLLPAQAEVWPAFMAQHGPQTDLGQPVGGPMAWLLLPSSLLFDAAFASPRFDGVVGGILPLALVALGLQALAAPRHRSARRFSEEDEAGVFGRELAQTMAPLAAALIATWLASSWQARFLIPLLWLCALWLTLSWRPWLRLSGEPEQWPRRATRAGAYLVVGAIQVAFWPSLRGHMPAFHPAALGQGTERALLRARLLPGSEACQALQASDSAMLVWTQRQLLFCPQASIADSFDEGAHLDAWLAEPARGRGAELTHILIDLSLWQAPLPSLPESEQVARHRRRQQWQDLQRMGCLKPLSQGPQPGVALMAVRPAACPAGPAAAPRQGLTPAK